MINYDVVKVIMFYDSKTHRGMLLGFNHENEEIFKIHKDNCSLGTLEYDALFHCPNTRCMELAHGITARILWHMKERQ